MAEIKKITCIECPMGCDISVEIENQTVISVSGNVCPRGEIYSRNEVVCPRRVITTTVRTKGGRVVPVKTDKPVKKSEMFEIMKIINSLRVDDGIKENDVIVADITEDINLIAVDDEI